jgi:hypothetical protein
VVLHFILCDFHVVFDLENDKIGIIAEECLQYEWISCDLYKHARAGMSNSGRFKLVSH